MLNSEKDKFPVTACRAAVDLLRAHCVEGAYTIVMSRAHLLKIQEHPEIFPGARVETADCPAGEFRIVLDA